MKKLMSLTAALVLAAFMTTSCGLLSGASASATPSSSGTTTGSALYSLFTQFLKDGKLDTSNLSNIINLATLATSIQGLKGKSDNSSTLADFAAGLVKGSNNTISQPNSSTITNILSGLVNNTDLSSLAALLTRGNEVTEETVAEVNKTPELTATADVVSNIFKLMSK